MKYVPYPNCQRCPNRISGTCEDVKLCGKRNFADVIKVMDLQIENYPGLSGWEKSNGMNPLKQRIFSGWGRREMWWKSDVFQDKGNKGNGYPIQYSCLENSMGRGYSPWSFKGLNTTE